jgi:hypothetical protein
MMFAVDFAASTKLAGHIHSQSISELTGSPCVSNLQVRITEQLNLRRLKLEGRLHDPVIGRAYLLVVVSLQMPFRVRVHQRAGFVGIEKVACCKR